MKLMIDGEKTNPKCIIVLDRLYKWIHGKEILYTYVLT